MATYSIFIHVPIYVDSNRSYVTPEWRRALELLRDSFDNTFSRFILLAPSLPAQGVNLTIEPIGRDDGFLPRPSVPANVGRRAYYFGARRLWLSDVRATLEETDFAHTVVDDLYRPLSFDASRLVCKSAIPHAFFVDTDIILQNQQLIDTGLKRGGLDQKLYLMAYERAVRARVSRANVTFLKGKALMDRYAGYAGNPKFFHDTSYRSSEVVAKARVAKRLARRTKGSLKFVYAGRLVARKGCSQAIKIVKEARDLGADISFDLIGDGEDRSALEALANGTNEIRFLGERPYGSELIKELSGYDGMLFTPLSEDTPRMIFDGYAAGLPLIAYDIPYVRERAAEDAATMLLPFEDIEASANALAELTQSPDLLAALTFAALEAGHNNSTEKWYSRRAKWTLEAFHP